MLQAPVVPPASCSKVLPPIKRSISQPRSLVPPRSDGPPKVSNFTLLCRMRFRRWCGINRVPAWRLPGTTAPQNLSGAKVKRHMREITFQTWGGHWTKREQRFVSDKDASLVHERGQNDVPLDLILVMACHHFWI